MEKATQVRIRDLMDLLEKYSKNSDFCNLSVDEKKNVVSIDAIARPNNKWDSMSLEDLENLI